jgi:hypothetical protein
MIKTVDQYKSELKDVANGLNIYGDHVDLITNMLAYALYSSGIDKARQTRELSLIKSTSINSKIQRAMDRNYSVFRGECPVLTLHVIPETNLEFSVGDVVFESADFNLYAAESKILNQEASYSGQTIKVRVSKEKKSAIFTPSRRDNYIEIIDNNISSTIHVNKDNLEIRSVRDFREHIQDNNSLYDLTITDYGFRLYRSTFNPGMFEGYGRGFIVTYYKYYDDMETLMERLRFIKIESIKVDHYDQPAQIKRETSKDIERNALHQYYTISMLRSNTDVMHIFHQIARDNLKESAWEYSPYDGIINIYLVPKDSNFTPTEIADISDEFTRRRNASYYIPQHFNITQARAAKFKAKITVYTYLYSQSVNQATITEIVNRYSKRLNYLLNLELLKSDISRVDNVNYVEIDLFYDDAPITGINITRGEKYNPRDNAEHNKFKSPSIYFDLELNLTIKSSEDIYRQ